MDLKEQLRDTNSKRNWDEIADYCVKNPSEIPFIITCCQDDEVKVQQNAAAVIGKLVDSNQSLLRPYLIKISKLLQTKTHDAVNRAVLRIFQFTEIPEEVEGELFDYVVNALKSQSQPIAIKAFGMTVARKICEKYPELSNELIPYIEIIVEERVSSGLVNRGKKELKKLKKPR